MDIQPARPGTPRRFSEALDQLVRARLRPGLRVSRQASPARLAPHGASFAAGVEDPEDAGRPLATGRFILLHDPARPEPWGGDLRVVTYLRAGVEPDVGSDALFSRVAWEWLLEALEGHGARHSRVAGTATRSFSDGFGALSGGEQSTEIELRASWTPQGPDLRRHLEAWGDVVCACAGLPPEPVRPARGGAARRLSGHEAAGRPHPVDGLN